MSVLRAGLIGCGMMGRHHARVLSNLAGVEFVGVVEDQITARENFPTARFFESLDAIIAEGIDYAVVAVPTEFHEEIALRLCANGIHAMIEKPLSINSDSSRRIATAYQAASLIGGVGHIERANPAHAKAREFLSAGDLGEIFQIQTRRQGPFPGRVNDVGVARDLGTHDFDLSAWLAKSKYKRVYAEAGFKSGRQHEDLISVTGALQNGILVSHQVNWLSPLKERRTIVNGALGALEIDTLTADLTFYKNGITPSGWEGISNFRGVSEGDVIRYAFPKPEPLKVEHEGFRDAVLGLGDDYVTMMDGLHAVEVADAVLQSISSGEVVRIEVRS